LRFKNKGDELDMENITIFQAITLAIAVIGAILGVINTLHGLDNVSD
jgi:hypothetical protein